MAQLKNERHEIFAQLIVAGRPPQQAYLEAGFSIDASNKNALAAAACRLIKKAKLQKRLHELQPEVYAKVQLAAARAVTAIEQDVLTRAGRVAVLAADLAATQQVIRERGAFPEHQEVPGGQTGYVVTSRVQCGTAKLMDERGKVTAVEPRYFITHTVDHKLIERRAALLDQIAQELGQKIDKSQKIPMTADEIEQLPAFSDLLEKYIEEGQQIATDAATDAKVN